MMEVDVWGAGRADGDWLTEQRRWARGWRRVIFPGVFLAYLLTTASGVGQYSHGSVEVLGFALLAAFGVVYIWGVTAVWAPSPTTFWALAAAAGLLWAAEVPIARATSFVMCVFIVVLAVARLHARAFPIVVAFTLLAVFVPPAVPSWHAGFSAAIDNGTAIAIPMVGLAMFGFFSVLRGNRSLAEARAEVARLAAENERIRIARDLHDLLGHSLTTITVKAELARRLWSSDQPGALREIGEVESLSRRALGDVRAAVANYREVTVAGELATGRELLRAAGITGDLPRAVDVVDDRAQELFGWVLREGLTNVVRHSHAMSCRVSIGADSVDIVDDGVGGSSQCGSGLSGLEERVAAAGGVMESGPIEPRGWRLHVSLASQRAPVS